MMSQHNTVNRILVLGDSLGADRPDGITRQERWPAILADHLAPADLVNRARTLATSRMLGRATDVRDFDLVVTQLGVVDGAPRHFSFLEQKLLARLPAAIRGRIVARRARRGPKSLDKRYVQPAAYVENYRRLAAWGVATVAIKILPVGEKFQAHSPTAQSSFDAYNTALDQVAALFPATFRTIAIEKSSVDAMTMDDGYHLNRAGHALIAERVAAAAREILAGAG